MAALALVGAVMTGCSSSEDNIINEQQPENKGNVVTLTTTVGLDEGGTTRALAIDYDNKKAEKKFAVDETMAVVYKNTSGNTVKAVSAALTTGDITNEGKSATFTFTLENPDYGEDVTYIYPAAMAKDNGDINYDALATQDGTLATLSSSLDLATYTAAWNVTSLPTGTLENQLAVCALTLKDNATTPVSTITSGLNKVTVSDGTNTYTVTPTGSNFGEDVIYVAIRPVTAALKYTATNTANTTYVKTATSREYEKGNFYNLGLRMIPNAINGKFSVSSTKQVYFSKGNLQAYFVHLGTYCTWRFAANQWDFIGDASKTPSGNGNIVINGKGSVSAAGTVDLFGWSTWRTALGIWNSTQNLDYGDGTFKDWGDDATVQAGIGTGWFTLSNDEWTYLISTRACSTVNGTANARFCKALLFRTTPGLIIFPDDYTHPADVDQPTNINATNNPIWNVNTYTTTNWGKMEAAGCVFLPIAGRRDGTTVNGIDSFEANYRSSTPGTSWQDAYSLHIALATIKTESDYRSYGHSVRLVHE